MSAKRCCLAQVRIGDEECLGARPEEGTLGQKMQGFISYI